MTTRSAPPATIVAALMQAFPRVVSANNDDRYDQRLNGYPPACPRRLLWPRVTLDPLGRGAPAGGIGGRAVSPDPDFAWLEEIALSDRADGEVVQAGGVAVVVRRRRPTLLDLAREAWPRIERMGVDAIARAHAARQPAWVSEGGTIWRLDPDGPQHVETRSADEIVAAARNDEAAPFPGRPCDVAQSFRHPPI